MIVSETPLKNLSQNRELEARLRKAYNEVLKDSNSVLLRFSLAELETRMINLIPDNWNLKVTWSTTTEPSLPEECQLCALIQISPCIRNGFFWWRKIGLVYKGFHYFLLGANMKNNFAVVRKISLHDFQFSIPLLSCCCIMSSDFFHTTVCCIFCIFSCSLLLPELMAETSDQLHDVKAATRQSRNVRQKLEK